MPNNLQLTRDFAVAGLEAKISLLCRVGTMLCAFPIQHVIETMRPLPLEVLPSLPDFIGGMAIVRGAPVPVLLMSRLFAREQSQPERLVVARVGERRVGFAVDAVIGVRTLENAKLNQLPPLLREASHDAVTAIGALDGELLVVLQTARVVPPEAFAAIEAEAGASS